MKILIRGAGFQNKGAEAMLRVVQREISRRISSVSFHVCVSPQEAPMSFANGIAPLYSPPNDKNKLAHFLPLASKISDYRLSKKSTSFKKAVKIHRQSAYLIHKIGQVDAVIDVSGFSYSDSCGWAEEAVKETWAWVDYCESHGKPYILMPQAWGPFEKKEIASFTKKIISSSALFVSRDEESTRFLSKLNGVEPSTIRISPDIAFRFRGAPSAVGNAILHNLGVVGSGTPLVGIVPNMRVYERTAGKGAANEYVRLLVALANQFIECHGANLLLAPNEIKVPGARQPDDRYLCGIVASQINNPDKCFCINEYYPSETVKSIIGQIDLLIASRFHSLVFALSQGVPVVALGWSHKYNELLRPFGLEKFVVDHDRLETAVVLSLVDEAWGQRSILSKDIQAAMPSLVAQVDALFDEVAEVILGAKC